MSIPRAATSVHMRNLASPFCREGEGEGEGERERGRGGKKEKRVEKVEKVDGWREKGSGREGEGGEKVKGERR